MLEFRDIFVANPDYFTMGKSPLSMENLLDYPILMLAPKSTTSEYLHQVFAAQGLKLLPEVELNSNDLLIDLAEIGLGIACIRIICSAPSGSRTCPSENTSARKKCRDRSS